MLTKKSNPLSKLKVVETFHVMGCCEGTPIAVTFGIDPQETLNDLAPTDTLPLPLLSSRTS